MSGDVTDADSGGPDGSTGAASENAEPSMWNPKLAAGVGALFTGAAAVFAAGRLLLGRRIDQDRR